MAFRKKAGFILAYKPDILVVPECEHPDKLKFSDDVPAPTGMLWFGTNKNKGLGIFSYGNFKLKLRRTHNPALKMIIPIAVTGGEFDLNLYAIWANNPQDKKNQYVGQIWKAISEYDQLLNVGSTILTGDFNSNTIWDRPSRIGNHSAVVEVLADKKIHSIYHKCFLQIQGQEKHPTFYLHRDKKKPYHLDYCFASEDLLSKVKRFKVGTYKNWIEHSDHSPLFVEFNL